MPSRDPEDPDFRRLWYVRYADDWLLGFSGPRHEAEEIKRRIGQFLRETLRLELSEAKTLITHARHHAARFLGYEVVALHADEKHDQRGQRIINGLVRLKVPNDVIVKQCRRYMRDGKAVHRPERLHDADFSIVSQYGAEYRGFVQYYLLAFNAHRLVRVHQVMRTSLLGTLANKHKTRSPRSIVDCEWRWRIEDAPRRPWSSHGSGVRARSHLWPCSAASRWHGRGCDLERPSAQSLLRRPQRGRPTSPCAEMRALRLRRGTFRGPPRPPSR